MKPTALNMKNKYIAGIYNYCDYWCERCPFTKRCRNYATDRELELEMEARDPSKPEPDDATNADFWKRIAHKTRDAAIFGKAEEWQDDAFVEDDFDIDPEWYAREEAITNAARQHPLMRLADAYRENVHAWLQTADADLKEVAQNLISAAANQLDTEDHEEQAREIGELLEVVTWYHTLISAKTNRAIRGLLEHASPEYKKDSMIAGFRLEDANGSAKLTLVSIERSIGAWLRLREILPTQEDAILQHLSMLDRLRRGLITALPGAKAFFRPGFDGEPPEDN